MANYKSFPPKAQKFLTNLEEELLEFSGFETAMVKKFMDSLLRLAQGEESKMDARYVRDILPDILYLNPALRNDGWGPQEIGALVTAVAKKASNQNLVAGLKRIAAEHPETRVHLLPLISR